MRFYVISSGEVLISCASNDACDNSQYYVNAVGKVRFTSSSHHG